jgi:hypothetical protein
MQLQLPAATRLYVLQEIERKRAMLSQLGPDPYAPFLVGHWPDADCGEC